MKRLILLGGLLITVLMLGACTSDPLPVEPTLVPVAPPVIQLDPTEWGGLPSIVLGVFQGTIKYGVPPHILKAGDTVDTWTELDRTPVLGHKKRDPISLKVWNGYGSDVRVGVSWISNDTYVGRVPGTGICTDSDGEYIIAPEYVREWFDFKTGEYTIPAKTVLDLPLYLYIPEDTLLVGRYMLQVGIVKILDTSAPMGITEAYIFKLKLDIG